MSILRPIALLLLLAILAAGCSSDTTPEAAVDTNKDAEAPASAAVDGSDAKTDDTPSENTSAENQAPAETDDAPTSPEGGNAEEQELMALQTSIQDALGGTQPSGPPTNAQIDEAIKIGEASYAKKTGNVVVANMLGGLIYQTMSFVTDETVLKQRRGRLGELAAELATNPDYQQNAATLYLESVKSLGDEPEKAWAAISAAKDLGFEEVGILYYDPAFKPIIENEIVGQRVKEWLSETVDAEFAHTDPFPFDFNLASFEGGNVSSKEYEGKPVIVDVWGTWCGPCKMVIPSLVAIADKYEGKLGVVGINYENPRGDIEFAAAKERLDAYKQQQPINYPCLHGNQETMDKIPEFQGFPTMLVLDASGRVRLKLVGFHPLPQLELIVEKLLAETASDS